ncbi:hypothetical protein [Bifidobacterium longum]|uniref:hypothetical protein n=1 Tax=Bifidobacterium longum TaxID=216816 RepID=UPI001925376E|nr:hypothetical protein [Bifidobacterium longum]MBL3897235.1 hypothetical protein [Bifidobacterium longum subsp. suis]
MKDTKAPHRQVSVVMHLFDRWLDHEDGTARMLCGATIPVEERETIASSEVVGIVSCPLCEAADIVDNLDVRLPEPKPPAAHKPHPDPEQPMFKGAESW